VRDKLKWIPLLFLIAVTAWLRLADLGYSDYQGDEIKALWRPAANESTMDFLYKQKKGPIQFFVTYAMRAFDPDFSNEFLQRLPFALAGILAIFVFYKLVQLHYGSKIALYASLLLSVNGIFIGLMRIIQYQPFVMLFMFLALYCFSLALQQERWRFRGITLGVAFWALLLFTHYDGVFIAPFAIYLLIRWYNQNADLPSRTRLKHLLVPFTVAGLLLAAYFIPYLLNIPEETKAYWSGRIRPPQEPEQEGRSSILNFELYNPIFSLYLYPILAAFSLPKLRQSLPLLAWFALPWVVLELIIFDPGTHIYTYLIPAIILLAFGLVTVEELAVKVIGEVWGRRLSIAGAALLFIVLAGISHLIFVDSTPEYPYEKRGMLFWTIGGGDQLREDKYWVFGFPYYRGWEEIRQFVTTTENNGYYLTNENISISDYYVPLKFDAEGAGHYIYIHNPQSFKTWDSRDKVLYWRENYKPVKIVENRGRVVAEIYYMPAGSLEAIRQLGY